MSGDRDRLEQRLAEIDPWRPQARTPVGSTEWGAAIRDAIVDGRAASVRRGRGRRVGRLILAGGGVAGLVALMVILILAGGGPESRPLTSAQAGVERIYLGVACPRADQPNCDRVGLSVSLDEPAMAVRATIDGRTFTLDDPSWSGPAAAGGSRRLFAGFLDPAGLDGGALELPESPRGGRWIGEPPVSAPVRLDILRPDGTSESVEEVVDLRPGWG